MVNRQGPKLFFSALHSFARAAQVLRDQRAAASPRDPKMDWCIRREEWRFVAALWISALFIASSARFVPISRHEGAGAGFTRNPRAPGLGRGLRGHERSSWLALDYKPLTSSRPAKISERTVLSQSAIRNGRQPSRRPRWAALWLRLRRVVLFVVESERKTRASARLARIVIPTGSARTGAAA